jgi:hypothetical protein
VKVNRNGAIETVEVTTDGEGFCSQADALLLTDLANRLGLTEALTEALAPTRSRRSAHADGEVLRELIITLSQGAEHLSDLAALREQPDLFGEVASDSTAFRALERIGAAKLEGIRAARKAARQCAFSLSARPKRIVLDVDATLLGSHSEKEQAAGNYKGSPDALLPGGLRSRAGRCLASQQRRLQHGRRPGGGGGSGAAAAARGCDR